MRSDGPEDLALPRPRRLPQPAPDAPSDLVDLHVARVGRRRRAEDDADAGEDERPQAEPAREGVPHSRHHRPQLRARHRGGESGAGERGQEEEDEGDGGERRSAVEERPAAVARQGDPQQEEQHAQADREDRVAAEPVAELHERDEGLARPARSAATETLAAQARGDSGGERGVVGQRAADEDAQVGDREGQALRALGEEGGVGTLGGAAEARPERLRAHDRPRGAHEERPVGHEVAPLGDRLVGDPLGHEPGHPGVAEAQGRARAERPRVEDHELGVEVDHPRGEEDRPGDAESGGGLLPEPQPACLGHDRSSCPARPDASTSDPECVRTTRDRPERRAILGGFRRPAAFHGRPHEDPPPLPRPRGRARSPPPCPSPPTRACGCRSRSPTSPRS